jgi:5-methylcytosine-specific restriction protein A
VSRPVPEWQGKDDGTPIPQRVKLRVYKKFGGVCQICFAKEKILGPEYDHRVALINGGKHAESNLQPVHPKCHRNKSNADVAEKSATYRTQIHHYGIKRSRNPMPGSKASGWRKRMDGRVERR